jgi:hypothetical protein
MPKCGLCGGTISRTLIPHGAICEDDTKANKLNDLRQENKMARKYYYSVLFNELTNEWEIDTEGEESDFPNGTIYNTETKEWEYGYAGDGVFTGKEEELTQALCDFIETQNKNLLKTGE